MPAQTIGRILLESAPRPRRGARPVIASIAVHAMLISASVWVTLEATTRATYAPPERVAIVDLSAFAPAATAPAAPAVQAQTTRPRGFQVVVAPANVPASLSIDQLKAPEMIPDDFTGRGVPGGLSSGVGVARVSLLSPNVEAIDETVADEPPYMLPGQMGPSYPEPLRNDGRDGLVVVRFVVDTLGRVERPTLDVVESTHPLFLASVRAALDRLRFIPARFSGQLVRVRMQQRFEFHLAGRR